MNILITGARGFMGKNLRSALTGRCGDAHRLMLLDMPHTEEELLAAAAEADFVFHLAGVNRPTDPADFQKGNAGFTRQLLTLLKERFTLPGEITPEVLARFPDVLTVTKAEEDVEAIAADICAVLDDALAAYNAMRTVEGEKLALDVGSRVDTIEETVGRVEVQSPQTVAAYRQRLETKMQEVLQSTTIDESRILTEAAIFADKVAVDEETVRLRSHIAQLRDMLHSSEPVGRKLDFLIQEVNRECNTIGSKCNDLTVARDVVNMKAEVEKIREQVQNME